MGGSTPGRRTGRTCDGREVAHSPWLRDGATVARMVRELALETDYLVVGSGALGMAFVDSLLEHSDADVVMVDRRHCPGGHWLDAYPFVRLHQPSAFYGVNSSRLGSDTIDQVGWNHGLYELATAGEICAYYERNEPSSPVPILLKRARRLSAMSFMEIVRDLTPAGTAELEVIRGPNEADNT